jgi:hypothetical protein
MGKVIIEILNKQGRVSERHKIDDLPCRIGRGYGNDLILSDPFISEDHIIVSTEADSFIVEDLNSKNGLFRKKSKQRESALVLKSGDEICIGKTTLRILSSCHPVNPALEFDLTKTDKKIKVGWINLWGTLIFCLSFFYVLQYLEHHSVTSVYKLMAKTLLVMPVIFIWAGVWSFLGKVIRQRSFFFIQFYITMWLFIASAMTTILLEYLEYNLNDLILSLIIKIICFAILIELFLYKHLSVATVISKKRVRFVSSAITCGLIGGSVFVFYAMTSDFNPNPKYSVTLKPPIGRFAPSHSTDIFFEENEKLFKKFSEK